jgi:hypothetical protein
VPISTAMVPSGEALYISAESLFTKFVAESFSEVQLCLQLVCLWPTLELISIKGGNRLLVQRCDPPKRQGALSL